MKRYIFLSLFSGLLLMLPFPNFNLSFFAWFGFVPLFFALKNKRKLQSFFLAYLAGAIFWSGIIYWLVHVTLPGTILLILYLALFFGIFGLVISVFGLPSSVFSLIFIPSVWVLLEYLRSHLFTGLPWVLLGYSQYSNLPVIQIADITGAWGISFLVMMVNVLIYYFISYPYSIATEKRKYLFTFLCIAIAFIYGYYRMLGIGVGSQELGAVKTSVIQGNISQELKWDPRNKDVIINKYINLTAQAAKDRPDLIIWPEASLPCILGQEGDPCYYEYEKINKFIKKINIPLLLGTVNVNGDFLSSNYYNSALLISGEGKLLKEYHKIHLVPFGEYIPLKKFLPFLQTVVPIGDITAGGEYTIFKLETSNSKPQANFAVLICFEDLFPELSRQFVKKGAHFLVNITNDAWYKRSPAAQQHLQASVFRTVENRVYLARAANTGVSGFISPTGKIISLVQDESLNEIFVDGFATGDIFMPQWPQSFYTRYGDIFVGICFIFVVYYAIFTFKKKP